MSWYQHWFADALYMELYAHRDAAEARQAVDLFAQVTGMHDPEHRRHDPDHRRHDEAFSSHPYSVLDLACGTGRHAFELARRGYLVTAADLSPTLLAAAARKTQRFGPRLRLLRCDMRHLPFRTGFHAVLQLFTAFGYFHEDSENERVIAEVARILRPGGWYMLDFLNATALASTLTPRSETRTTDARIAQERRIVNGRVEKRIHIMQHGEQREYVESVRLFTPDDFRAMFARQALSLEDIRGDYTGAMYAADSPRCILFARRMA
ncbi:MAG: class I SAM-dependent methyltransferase [Bacteroidota bacterium]|jgi:ubiquinone/menaquinone biosynthesis C-methylase UbiE|nr:class I SAM-dependent methyltransferase [Bacteroidota bacterium]